MHRPRCLTSVSQNKWVDLIDYPQRMPRFIRLSEPEQSRLHHSACWAYIRGFGRLFSSPRALLLCVQGNGGRAESERPTYQCPVNERACYNRFRQP